MTTNMTGHNLGQAPSPEQVREFLNDTTRDLLARANELEAGAGRVPEVIDTEDVAQRAADMAKMIRAAERKTDARRTAEKEPYANSASAVDGFFKPIISRLEKARKAVQEKLADYQKKKADRERKQREDELRRQKDEAERKAHEAREAEAAAKAERDKARKERDQARKAAAAKVEAAPPKPEPDPAAIARQAEANTTALLARQAAQDADAKRARAAKRAGAKVSEMGAVRGDYGGLATLQEFWDIESINMKNLDLEALRPHLSADDVKAAVGKFASAAGGRPEVARREILQKHPQPSQVTMAQKENQAVATINPRLPFPSVQMLKSFELSQGDWLALVDAIFPTASTTASVILALSYCRKRGLDPFKRVIHIVAIYDAKKKRMVDTIWPGIGELRTTAHRTRLYAGRDKVEYGPDITEEFQPVDNNGRPKGKPYSLTYPEWAQVTVYRVVGDQPMSFAGPEVYWKETYFRTKHKLPNSMWQQRPRGQLAKCAEAAALRAAFPEEIGDWTTDDEVGVMQRVDDWGPDGVTDAPERPTRGQGPKKSSARTGGRKGGDSDGTIAGDVIEATTSHGEITSFTLPAEKEEAHKFLLEWGVLAAHDNVVDEFLQNNANLIEALGADPDQLAVVWQERAQAATPTEDIQGDGDARCISDADFQQLVTEAKAARHTHELAAFLKSKRVGNIVNAIMTDDQRDAWLATVKKLEAG